MPKYCVSILASAVAEFTVGVHIELDPIFGGTQKLGFT